MKMTMNKASKEKKAQPSRKIVIKFFLCARERTTEPARVCVCVCIASTETALDDNNIWKNVPLYSALISPLIILNLLVWSGKINEMTGIKTII